MSSRTTKVPIAQLLAGALVALLGVPGMAASEPTDVPDGMDWNPTTGELRSSMQVDAERYAAAFGSTKQRMLTKLRPRTSWKTRSSSSRVTSGSAARTGTATTR
jgi:hypothetical protein